MRPTHLLASLILATAASAAPLDSPVITIDPGHPSEVSDGAQRLFGTSEVHEAWEVANKLKPMLEARGFSVVMTKSAERQMVKNRRRAEIANEAHAALMIRLHCDAAAGSGYALYAPDRKGHTQGVTGPSDAIIAESGRAARAMHAAMAPALAGELKDNGVKGDSATFVGGKQGALTGSIFSLVPVVTIEMVVLTNASDASWIQTDGGRTKMAHALALGVHEYVRGPGGHPPAASRSSQPSPASGARPSAR